MKPRVERELGIPAVTHRLIQQALLQILQPILAPTFSEPSYGFRAGRRAQDAVLAAQTHRRRRSDPADSGLPQQRDHERWRDAAAVPGHAARRAMSPLLANVILDEVDKELERRGHHFVRYADDANVYVRSRRAGERGMALLRRLYGKLHLTVNETKSAVASVFGRNFLSYSLWVARGREVRRRVADKPLATFKQRVRQLTRRSGGRSIQQVVDGLRPYLLGWKAYFGLAQTPGVRRELDERLRHRLRAIQLKQWRRGTTIYRELRAMGAKPEVARKVAANSRC